MNKKFIRLNESELHKIVKESVNRILKESIDVNQYEQLLQNVEYLFDQKDISVRMYTLIPQILRENPDITLSDFVSGAASNKWLS